MNSNKFEEIYIRIEEFTLVYIQLLATIIFVYIFYIIDKLGILVKKVMDQLLITIYVQEFMLIIIFFIIPVFLYLFAIYLSYLILFKFKIKVDDDVIVKYKKLNVCYKRYEELRKLIILILILLLLLSLAILFII